MQNNISKSSMLNSYISQNSGQTINSGQNYGAFTSPQPKLKLDNSDKFENNKSNTNNNSKKGKIAKIALLSSLGLTAATAIVASFRHKGGIVKSFKNFASKTKDIFNNGAEATKKTTKKAMDSLSDVKDFQKGADNLSNAKDSSIRLLFGRIPGYKKFDNWASNLYKKAINKTLAKKYSKAQEVISAGDDLLLEAAKKANLDPKDTTRLQELLAKRKEKIKEFISSDAIGKRIDEISEPIEHLEKDALKSITGLNQEGWVKGAKRLSKESFAKERLEKAKKIQESLIGSFKDGGLNSDEAAELRTLTEKALRGDSGITGKKIEQGKKLFQRAYNKESVDLFEKVRDINYGCAPADIIGLGSTVGLLGLYTAQADSKEERVGVTLTTGIPLAVSLGTTVLATTKMVSGAKALILGGITGLASNAIGKFINNKYKKAHNIKETPKTIVTIDDYTGKVKEQIMDKIQ